MFNLQHDIKKIIVCVTQNSQCVTVKKQLTVVSDSICDVEAGARLG